MLALLLGAGSGVNPSQGIPGPFSFKRLQIWITDALVERTAQLINRSSPTSRNHSPHPSTFSSSPVCHIAPANKPCAAVRLHVPDENKAEDRDRLRVRSRDQRDAEIAKAEPT